MAPTRTTAMGWAAYCSRDYAGRQGCPVDINSLCRHAVIGAEGAIAALPGWRWLQQAAPEAEVVARSSSITNMISAVKAGLGVSVLPCVLADTDPALVRCMGPIEGARSDLWLLTREELRDVPRVRAFLDFLAAYIADMRHLLAGEQDQFGLSMRPETNKFESPALGHAAAGLVAGVAAN